MTTCFLAPDPCQSTFFIPGGAVPGNGVQVFFYVAGSVSTKQTVYKDPAANVAWSNPIILDSGGNNPLGGEVWFPSGQTFKVVWAPINDSDPPLSHYRTMDNLSGINDVSSTSSEWISGPTPTFISATSFSLAGDQTAVFTVGRRIKTTNTGGTIYSTIKSSVFGAVTTITVVNDTGVIDSGLSAVFYGILNAANNSVPLLSDFYPVARSSSSGFSANLNLSQLSTNQSYTLPNTTGTLALAPALINYLKGFTISNSVSSTAMDLSSGYARDFTNSTDIFSSGLNNKTQAVFAAGASSGARLSAAVMSSNAWYAWYALGGSSGAADFGFDLAFPPGVPNTTVAFPFYRYIGGRKTNASTTEWAGFVQHGNSNYWTSPPPLDFSGAMSTAARSLKVVQVPPVVCLWKGNTAVTASGPQVTNVFFTDPALSDVAVGNNVTPLSSLHIGQNETGTTSVNAQVECWTNSSSQIGARGVNANSVQIQTLGWIDLRGTQ